MELLLFAEVPFSDERRRIAGILEASRDRRLIDRQSLAGAAVLHQGRVELVAEARLVAACQHAGPRRTAIGTGDVTARAANAVLRQRVDVRRRHLLESVNP